jgi:hypothetical protein
MVMLLFLPTGRFVSILSKHVPESEIRASPTVIIVGDPIHHITPRLQERCTVPVYLKLQNYLGLEPEYVRLSLYCFCFLDLVIIKYVLKELKE